MNKFVLIALVNVVLFNVAKAQVIDKEKLECQYKFTWVQDTSKRNVRKEDYMILKVGDKTSDFYSLNTYRVDSAIQANIHISANEMPGKHANYGKKGATYHIFKNYPSGKVTVTDKVANDNFRYEETISQAWRIEPGKSTIMGYAAMKATCTFSGREYTAWFTTYIPVSSGPWKFSGLPGLILKVEDKSGDFKFEMLGLQQINDSAAIEIASKPYINTTKSSFQKLTEKFHKDPIAYINQNTGMKITGGTGSMERTLPYNPIELY